VLRARIIDPKARFEPPPDKRFFAPLWARFRAWLKGAPEPAKPLTSRPRREAIAPTAPVVVLTPLESASQPSKIESAEPEKLLEPLPASTDTP
jgi:penicillin-binding protein 1A